MQRLRLAELAPVAWRNGGGLTLEIAHGGAGADGGMDWDWRLSVATIAQDGPFSTFAGVDRSATLVDGAVRLVSAAQTLDWTAPGETHGFAGETAFTARLAGGRARFFNVMVRRGRLVAAVTVHRQPVALPAVQAVQHGLLVLGGRFAVTAAAGTELLDAEEGLLCAGTRPALQLAPAAPGSCLAEVRLSAVAR